MDVSCALCMLSDNNSLFSSRARAFIILAASRLGRLTNVVFICDAHAYAISVYASRVQICRSLKKMASA